MPRSNSGSSIDLTSGANEGSPEISIAKPVTARPFSGNVQDKGCSNLGIQLLMNSFPSNLKHNCEIVSETGSPWIYLRIMYTTCYITQTYL